MKLASYVALTLFAAGAVSSAQELKDYTKTKPEDLGVKLVEPMKDAKTGFIVGGKNSTDVIRKLTAINDIKIADLERVMRPGKLSNLGFLGKDEKLVDVLVMDNELIVDKLGLTHQEIARHLHVLGAIGVQREKENATGEFLYHGRKFKTSAIFARGFQESPFQDDTKSNTIVTIVNVDAGKTLPCALLVPHMIERYGFYEGKGTPYRVDPLKILEVLDFLRKTKN